MKASSTIKSVQRIGAIKCFLCVRHLITVVVVISIVSNRIAVGIHGLSGIFGKHIGVIPYSIGIGILGLQGIKGERVEVVWGAIIIVICVYLITDTVFIAIENETWDVCLSCAIPTPARNRCSSDGAAVITA